MQLNDACSVCGSSTCSTLGSYASRSSSSYDFVKFKKPPRNFIITNDSINDQKLAKQKRKQQVAENEREQKRLELEVILSGFPVKPVVKTVVEKFLKNNNVSIDKVRQYHQFESKGTENPYYIIIVFKGKSTISKLCNVIRWSRLSDNNQIDDPFIVCKNRLSKFNLEVKKQLGRLKAKRIIEDYKFQYVFHCYQQTPNSEWKVVSVIEDISHLNDLLKYVNYV